MAQCKHTPWYRVWSTPRSVRVPVIRTQPSRSAVTDVRSTARRLLECARFVVRECLPGPVARLISHAGKWPARALCEAPPDISNDHVKSLLQRVVRHCVARGETVGGGILACSFHGLRINIHSKRWPPPKPTPPSPKCPSHNRSREILSATANRITTANIGVVGCVPCQTRDRDQRVLIAATRWLAPRWHNQSFA